MPRNLHDTLAKNILHDVFSMRGFAQTEAEVSPGNARRIDLWFVPEHNARTESAPEFVGILAEITAEPSAHEVWCDGISVDDFFAALVKRELWRDVLEQRDKRPWPRPMLWHQMVGESRMGGAR